MANPDALRLAVLTELRETAGLTQSEMAHRCGLNGKQARLTAGAWEMGRMTPSSRRRIHFSGYLWDDLGLRNDPPRFADIWEMLCEEWDWDPLTDQEWHRLTNQPRPTPATSATEEINTPAVAPTRLPFQAPSAPHHFVGRADLLEQLTEELTTTDGTQVVALVGMGGIGKTTLATHTAHTLRSHFPDGVLWAQTAISTPLDILQSWARAFGYDYSELHDVESCAAALRSAVATRKILYVLDNVESVQRVRPLLIGGEGSTVLLTTRSEDAAVALGAQIQLLGELSSAESTELLVSLLGKERVEKEKEAATQIGELLHHLPLAVEIVGQLLAARSRRPLAQMAQRLQNVGYRLDLQISDRDVRTSFLVSWEALDGEHQRLFAHLAVFAGRSFTLQALAALLGEDADVVWDQLDLLVARSLVKETGDDRYSQHPLLADFAREQLGDAPAVWARFAESQLVFAQEHQSDYDRLDLEWDNVMAGMEAAHRLEAWEMVVAFAEALGEAWERCGRFHQARQGYEWTVAAAKALQNEELTAANLQRWASTCIEQNDYEKADQLLQQAVERSMQLESDELIANIRWDLARTAIERSDYKRAQPLLKSCREIRQYLQDAVGMAAVDYWQALIAYREQDYETATTLCRQSLSVQETENDYVGMLRTLRLLTDIELVAKNLPAAKRYAQRAHDLAEAEGELGELGAALFSLCTIERRLGNFVSAELHIQRSQPIFERIGSRTFLAFTYHELGQIYASREYHAEGLMCAQQCTTILRAVGDEFNLTTALYGQGNLHLALQEQELAQHCWQEALTLAEQQQHTLAETIRRKLNNVVMNGDCHP